MTIENCKTIKDIVEQDTTSFLNTKELFDEYIRVESKIVKDLMYEGLKNELNKIYSSLSSISKVVDEEIARHVSAKKNGNTYDVFNMTTGTHEKGLHAASRCELEAIFESSEEKIEILREYDGYGNVIWENPNPKCYISDDRFCDKEDDSYIKDIEEEVGGKILCGMSETDNELKKMFKKENVEIVEKKENCNKKSPKSKKNGKKNGKKKASSN